MESENVGELRIEVSDGGVTGRRVSDGDEIDTMSDGGVMRCLLRLLESDTHCGAGAVHAVVAVGVERLRLPSVTRQV